MDGQDLVEWFRKRARALPWRSSKRDPYHVVVSEFMLQQTQVDRVIPRFESFIRRFPSFASLAAAEEDDVVGEWSGLGYYRRARMLHRLAEVVADGGGQLPATASELEELPGIGPYTAAAVASLAWGEAVPVLDGNTLRVGARVLALEGDPRAARNREEIGSWILSVMEKKPPGEVNEALMELGATVCTPGEPICGECPFEDDCRARALGLQHAIPAPRRRRAVVSVRWAAACIVDKNGRWLVKRVDEGPILRGLWLPPLVEVEAGVEPKPAAARLCPFEPTPAGTVGSPIRHNITHRKIDVVPVRFAVESFDPPSSQWAWVDPDDPGVPTSSLLQKLVESLRD